MPNTRRHLYDINFKLKIVAEAEVVNNNREITHEYSISESMVRTRFAVDPQSMARDSHWFNCKLVKSYGISNALDSTKDNAVWDEEEAGGEEVDDQLENSWVWDW